MNTVHLRRVRRLFWHEGVPTSTSRHNARQWVKSVRHLGGEWLYIKRVERIA